MKHTALILLLAASSVAAIAQTPAKPAAPAAKPAAVAAKAKAVAEAIKLPPGVPAVKGDVKTAFSLRYQDVLVGSGADAEPNKMYKVFYTGWLAADGHKFDSTDDHPRAPVLDKDGKPVLDEDGKPKQGDIQPISFPQGMGRVIPGWDQGFEGMKVGGKRRLFIPWELAYGAKGRPGRDEAHPGIPPKADLIFDIELVDISEMPAQSPHPPMRGVRPAPAQLGAPASPAPAAGAALNAATPAPAPSPNPAATPAPAPASAPAAAPATQQSK